VIGGAAVLYLLEFLADKIPWIDSLWDAIHTLVRPIGAAVIAVVALGPASPGMEVAAALLGAAIGASTHAAKAGTRLAVNASPEPASNIAVSLLEDGFVVGLVLLLLTHPLLGLGLAVAALVFVVVLLAVLFRLVMRRRRRRESTIP
jgi:O-antigen/teichoic acid export membrane protein